MFSRLLALLSLFGGAQALSGTRPAIRTLARSGAPVAVIPGALHEATTNLLALFPLQQRVRTRSPNPTGPPLCHY